MTENASLNGCIDQIELGFVEREATPQLLMKLGIQLHLARLLLSNTVSLLDIFGVDRARSTIHNWVHRADLQPEQGQNPDHVAVDETVIQLGGERYWLHAAVDPESNDLLYTKFEPVRTNVFAHAFFDELREKHDVDDAVFLADGAIPLQDACSRHGLDVRYERHGNRNSVERIFREVKRRTPCFSNCFTHAEAETVDEWLRSFAFAWISLSEHYPQTTDVFQHRGSTDDYAMVRPMSSLDHLRQPLGILSLTLICAHVLVGLVELMGGGGTGTATLAVAAVTYATVIAHVIEVNYGID